MNAHTALQIALVWTLFETGSASVRSGAILSAYIYLCTGSNSTVGYVQGITGIAQVRSLTFLLFESSKLYAPAGYLPHYLYCNLHDT